MGVKSCYTAFAMDVKSFETLELSVVLERVAEFTAFSASKTLARSLTPSSDLEQVQQWQAATTEACKLLSVRTDLTVGGARDVRTQVRAAARGAVLEPIDLLDLKSTLIAARTLRRQLEKTGGDFPTLTRMSLDLRPLPNLIDSISKTLDERGEVQDSASEKLTTIRRDMRIAHDRLTSKLERMLSDPKIAPLLQEPIITQREGRFVIPLRADFKGRVEAVVHDQSASGATLFIEPLQVVDLNNQVRELRLAERDEIRRILADLSQRIGEQVEAIEESVEALANLDLAFAKARYADSIKADEPILKAIEIREDSQHPGSTLRLLDARHPLLDSETVVPVDLVLDAETYALVVTGPNTGGKTVSLKTAGLLALMAQCGLHIPATSGSELSVFDAIYADIGDEQSIEQSLSTFSSHISNIINILERATSKSLVLLDELGAGTDPQEGAALARAILGTLLDRSITTIVATHYPEMKTFAHATAGVCNASVEFDMESLRPTYHLTIGLPGRSNALAIAQRLGLEDEIVERARTMVTPEDLRAESLLDEIHQQRDLARRERVESEAARMRAQSHEVELSRRLEEIEDERRALLEAARREAEQELETFRRELRVLRKKLNAARLPLEELKTLEIKAEAMEGGIVEPLVPTDADLKQSTGTFQPGDEVHLRTINATGVITALDQDQAEVQVGRLRVRARLDELISTGDLMMDEVPKREKGHLTSSRHRSGPSVAEHPPIELDLRGRTVDEALDELERRLDAAYLAAMPFVRIIHGKGTGRLRKAIRQALGDNPYVASFEPGQPAEGGDGVTVIRLALA
ncbi:MAG: endonuclease MutS2 [Anaerolineales bacterium]|nr:endonuclease MutS2 [Anaerolineales bacterium]